MLKIKCIGSGSHILPFLPFSKDLELTFSGSEAEEKAIRDNPSIYKILEVDGVPFYALEPETGTDQSQSNNEPEPQLVEATAPDQVQAPEPVQEPKVDQEPVQEPVLTDQVQPDQETKTEPETEQPTVEQNAEGAVVLADQGNNVNA